MRLRLLQVDAFTSRRFGGNPAAVVPLDAWLPDGVLQAIAAENNLAETAFIVPTRGADGRLRPAAEVAGLSPAIEEVDYALRWFTPGVEMDLCGHATLATAFVIEQILGHVFAAVRFSSRSGPLTVRRTAGRLELDFPARPGRPISPPPALAAALGAAPREVLAARDWLAIYDSAEQVAALRPDFARVAALDTFAVIASAAGTDCDFVSRFFAPRAGVPEDPVTGSAHCTLIPYWAQRLGKTEMFARQISARGGELHCRLSGNRVGIGGDAVMYLDGWIEI